MKELQTCWLEIERNKETKCLLPHRNLILEETENQYLQEQSTALVLQF